MLTKHKLFSDKVTSACNTQIYRTEIMCIIKDKMSIRVNLLKVYSTL